MIFFLVDLLKLLGIFVEFLQSVDAGGYGNFYLNAEVRRRTEDRYEIICLYLGISMCWFISISTKC